MDFIVKFQCPNDTVFLHEGYNSNHFPITCMVNNAAARCRSPSTSQDCRALDFSPEDSITVCSSKNAGLHLSSCKQSTEIKLACTWGGPEHVYIMESSEHPATYLTWAEAPLRGPRLKRVPKAQACLHHAELCISCDLQESRWRFRQGQGQTKPHQKPNLRSVLQ